MKRNLRVLALIFAVFAGLSFASASVASAQGHHDTTVNNATTGNDHSNSNNSNGNGHNSDSSTTTNNGQPQPLSNADMNGNGANPGTSNTTVPYQSTRDGSPSLNGNGNGNAVGKPCAGCVGKADNKNPPGQQPGGGDHNAGYECDRNNGIGKSNPAHTGCTTTTTQPVTTTTQPTTTTTQPTTTTSPTTASPTTTSGGAGLTPSSGGQPQTGHPASATAAATHPGSLAFTGLDSRLIALGALGLVLTGLLLFFASKLATQRQE